MHQEHNNNNHSMALCLALPGEPVLEETFTELSTYSYHIRNTKKN